MKQGTAKNQELYRRLIKPWHEKHPWAYSYSGAKYRSTNPNGCYYHRGIKFSMKMEDFKFLWFRDKAYEMEHPSIDRIDSNGDYVLENCRYIEWLENALKGLQNAHRVSRGQDRPASKLKNSDVLKIIKSKKSNVKIAKEYSVSSSTINNIKNGIVWSWLTGIKRKV